MKKQGFFKLILTNIGILIALMIGINFILISGWEARRLVNLTKEVFSGKQEERIDPRTFLPNYKNSPWAGDYFRDFNTLRDDHYKSYIGWKKTVFTSKYINIDSTGNRITPQIINPNDSLKRVVFLGGSTMWGTGSPDDGTIPAYFVKAGLGAYQAENFGESAFRAMQSYIYLLLKFNEGFQADWVISYDGVNDAVGFLDDNDGIGTIAERRIQEKLKQKEGLHASVTNLTYRNFFFGPIENTITRFKNKQLIVPERKIILTPERTDRVARALLDSWLATRDLAKKNGANYLAVLQPNAALGKPNISHLTFDQYESLLMRTYEQLYNRVRELLTEDQKYEDLSDHVLDLTQSLNGDTYYYIDWCHVSPNGNEIIANQILQRINQNTLKP